MYETLNHFSTHNIWRYQPFFIRCRRPSITVRATLSHEQARKNAWPWAEKKGRYSPTRLSVRLLPWQNARAKVIFIGNRPLHSWKGMAGCYGHSWMVGIRTVWLEPATPAAEHCSCRVSRSCVGSTGGQGKLTYFRYSPWLPVEAALSIFNVSFFVKRIF